MNRREFLKKGLEGIVISSIPFISCTKNPIDSDLEGNTYIVQTIQGHSMEEVIKDGIPESDCPLKINLIDYKPESPFEGSVELYRLGWIKIENYEEYIDKKNRFYISTKGKLGSIERFYFSDLEITDIYMKGLYQFFGTGISTYPLNFTATNKENLIIKK